MTRWKAGWPPGSPLLGPWLDAARKRAFESAFEAPEPTPLAEIARAPQDFDGKLISVEGRIGPVAITHRGSKAISSTSVSDASGAVIRAGLTHIKLDSGGLVLGSYAHLTGTYALSHADFDTPVLMLDRRNLTADAEASWLDWLELELLPVITPTPHGLGSRWSWMRGTDGPGNLLRFGTWAKSSHGRSF
jgi:hypothetical protein